MKIADSNKQKKIRRKAAEAMLVYDLITGLPMGQIIDMSAKGMKIMSEGRVNVHQIYYCRISLDKKIKGRWEVVFDAECRWCKNNDITGWYDSGYALRLRSQKDADIVGELTNKWMKDHSDKLNSSNRYQFVRHPE